MALATCGVTCIAVAVTVLVLTAEREFDPDAVVLFPQLELLGGASIATYGNNGQASYVVHKAQSAYGPDGHAEITLTMFGRTEEHSAGWVIFFLRGVSLQRFKEVRFLVRGHTGDERIGIKAKDAQGTEVAIVLEGRYLPSGRITTDWQEVVIPFSHFGRVKFGLMDNVSLYATGRMADTAPQRIAVRRWELR